jgi:hypothetical protein
MRTRPISVAFVCVLLALGAAAAPALARRVARGPTTKQIRAAVHRAVHSHDLWSTVNICNTPNYPNAIGIRGEMPALGFAAQLSMEIRVDYWRFDKNGFSPVAGIRRVLKLGTMSWGLHQAGYIFQFKPSFVLRGSVTFTWRLHGKVIGRAVRTTGGPYGHVDFSDPPGYSKPTCIIK